MFMRLPSAFLAQLASKATEQMANAMAGICRCITSPLVLPNRSDFNRKRPPAFDGPVIIALTHRPVAADFHHSVYVILLDPKVAEHPTILRANPRRDPAKPCVYVGMTGLPVEHRFENHKHGYKSAWTVRMYAISLMPELYEHLNPMPFEAAVEMEKDLAEDLRAQGYTVTGGH
jgi:hypothetical protein